MPHSFHIVDRFDVGWSGSALEALALADLVSGEWPVRVWSETEPIHPCYGDRHIRAIGEDEFPREGTVVLMGGYFMPGSWLEQSRPDRLIVKYNSVTHAMLFALLHRCQQARLPAAELVFPSRWLRDQVAMAGFIESSPVDLARFIPSRDTLPRPFTVGRLSRDQLYKHHEEDLSLYRLLAMEGIRVRVMGGRCLEPYLTHDPDGIELLSAGAESPETFLAGLDVFFYRSQVAWKESFGRVVIEAMACGKPVVAHPAGGYSEWIVPGENGFLCTNQEDCLDRILQLRADPPLRSRLGRSARLTVEAIYNDHAVASARAFYRGGP